MQTPTQPATTPRRTALWKSGFYLGEWRVDPLLGRIEGAEGTSRINPKAMDVLVYLASQPGAVCTKEEIFEQVWSETFVTEAVLTSAIWELRKALGDDARNPRVIETIPKRGYRLLAEVVADVVEDTVEDEGGSEATVSDLEHSEDSSGGWRHWRLAILILIASGLVVAMMVDRERPDLGHSDPMGDRPDISLAVLPFENNTGDEQLDWLRQGIPDMLAFDLGRSSYLRVVSLEAVSGILGVEQGFAARPGRGDP